MSRERLQKRIDEILDGSIGLNIFPANWTFLWRSGLADATYRDELFAGLQVAFIYFLLFFALPWVVLTLNGAVAGYYSLLLFQIYGAFWAGWATATTRIASNSVCGLLSNSIVPELSHVTAARIRSDLDRRFARRKILILSWLIGIAGAAAAGRLVYHDLSVAAEAVGPSVIVEPSPIAIIWWAVGWSILFTTSANVVNTSRFYRVFAVHLEDEPGKFYALNPARSTLVASVARVAQIMLLFWLGIAISIAFIIPFSIRLAPFHVDGGTVAELFHSLIANLFVIPLRYNYFVFCEILVTSIFSIGFGTVIFLRGEASIRHAVKQVTAATLRTIEVDAAALTAGLGDLDEQGRKRLTDLNALHKEITAAGSYRSLIFSGLSVLVPFVPLVSLLLTNLKAK